MKDTDSFVSVFYFRTAVEGSKALVTSSFKATRAAIETHFAGEVLEGTEEKVAADLLDEVGCYVNAPSSWVDLA